MEISEHDDGDEQLYVSADIMKEMEMTDGRGISGTVSQCSCWKEFFLPLPYTVCPDVILH